MRRRFAPHQLRHAHTVEMAREGVPFNVIQRQLGHAKLRVTTVYLQGIGSAEIIDTVHARVAPMMPGKRRTTSLSDRATVRPRSPERGRTTPSRRKELPAKAASRLRFLT